MAKHMLPVGFFLLKDGRTVSVALTVYSHKLGDLIERAAQSKGKKTSSWSGGAVELHVQEVPDGSAITIDLPPSRPVRRAKKGK